MSDRVSNSLTKNTEGLKFTAAVFHSYKQDSRKAIYTGGLNEVNI